MAKVYITKKRGCALAALMASNTDAYHTATINIEDKSGNVHALKCDTDNLSNQSSYLKYGDHEKFTKGPHYYDDKDDKTYKTTWTIVPKQKGDPMWKKRIEFEDKDLMEQCYDKLENAVQDIKAGKTPEPKKKEIEPTKDLQQENAALKEYIKALEAKNADLLAKTENVLNEVGQIEKLVQNTVAKFDDAVDVLQHDEKDETAMQHKQINFVATDEDIKEKLAELNRDIATLKKLTQATELSVDKEEGGMQGVALKRE